MELYSTSLIKFRQKKVSTFSEASTIQELNRSQELFFGKESVSPLVRCPHFNRVSLERSLPTDRDVSEKLRFRAHHDAFGDLKVAAQERRSINAS